MPNSEMSFGICPSPFAVLIVSLRGTSAAIFSEKEPTLDGLVRASIIVTYDEGVGWDMCEVRVVGNESACDVGVGDGTGVEIEDL